MARSISIFFAAAFLSLLALAPHAAGSRNRGVVFPCRWDRMLASGFPEGKVVARFFADCRKYTGGGTLIVDIRLFKFNSKGKTWRTVRGLTKRWSDLSQPRWVQLIEPCTPGQYRATFLATLRGSGGAAVGTVDVKSGPVDVTVPCAVHLNS